MVALSVNLYYFRGLLAAGRKRVIIRESLQVGADWPSLRFSGALGSNKSRGYAKYSSIFRRERENCGLLGGERRIELPGPFRIRSRDFVPRLTHYRPRKKRPS